MAEPKNKKGAVRTWPQVRVFRELLRANARVMALAREFVEAETGLSFSEFDMLLELGNQTGLRMSDLAAKMVVSPANVTRLAQSLAAKGLVVRERAQHSDREVLARLTPEGQELFARHFPKAAAFMAGLMDERLTAPEQATLGELLEKLSR
ncbi:MAG TPA: MarR family transcriptional regulator [Polyangiaceae bacterium]|nr:MarR family transcriptional regulator [Polyangiaceae bacterium]